MTIGQNIKTFRNKQGLTQSKLSELTGIAEVTIRKYESGKITPKAKNLNRLAKGLGVSPSDLDETIINKTLSEYTNEEILEELKRRLSGIK